MKIKVTREHWFQGMRECDDDAKIAECCVIAQAVRSAIGKRGTVAIDLDREIPTYQIEIDGIRYDLDDTGNRIAGFFDTYQGADSDAAVTAAFGNAPFAWVELIR